MRLNSVRLGNFRQHADSEIVFDSGLTGIIGPNGAGKTTILEAIAWALYGNSAARGTRDSIRFLRAGPRASVKVELDFDLGPHRYRVVRGLTSAELYLDGGSAPIANTITGVTELIHRRLGMSRSEFFNTYFTGQKELNVMAAMGPSERAQFLSRVLGYERLRTAQDLARERRRMLTAEILGLRAGMPDPDQLSAALTAARERVGATEERRVTAERRREELHRALAAITPKWEAAGRERERLQTIMSELAVAESEEASLGREGQRLEVDLRELDASQRALAALGARLAALPALREEQGRLDALRRDEGRRQVLVESERTLAAELVRLRERLAKLETAPALEREIAGELQAKRGQAEAVERELEALRIDWVRDRQEAETKLQSLRNQFAELREQRERLVALGDQGICPTCNRALGEAYRGVLELLDDQIETMSVDGKFYRTRLEQLEPTPEPVVLLEERRRAHAAELTALERKLAKVQAAVHELAGLRRDSAEKDARHQAVQHEIGAIPAGYDAARHAEVTRAIAELVPDETNAARLAALVERTPKLERERKRVDSALAAARQRVETLRAARASVQLSESDYQALSARHERAATDARAAELAAVEALADARNAVALLDAARHAHAEMERMQRRLDEMQTERRLHEELDRAFTDLRTELNAALRPELSELASAFLTELTDDRYSELELDEQYNACVIEDGVPKPVISGGEEDLANLVLRLAISQMIAERAGQTFSLLILDEVFGSLDDARRQGVISLLRRLHDRFEQVILITHVESVREGLDRVIVVRYDEERGASAVDQSAPPALPALAGVGDGGEGEGALATG